jgi:hypothetical protein
MHSPGIKTHQVLTSWKLPVRNRRHFPLLQVKYFDGYFLNAKGTEFKINTAVCRVRITTEFIFSAA